MVVVCCWLIVARCLLFGGWSLLFEACRVLLVICWLARVVNCVFVGCCVFCVMLEFVVCCLLGVGRGLL